MSFTVLNLRKSMNLFRFELGKIFKITFYNQITWHLDTLLTVIRAVILNINLYTDFAAKIMFLKSFFP